MENEPKEHLSEEAISTIEDNQNKFAAAFKKLTDEEKSVISYIHFHFSGENEHKLPKQDELEKSTKEKLKQAGIDTNNLDQYLEAHKQ